MVWLPSGSVSVVEPAVVGHGAVTARAVDLPHHAALAIVGVAQIGDPLGIGRLGEPVVLIGEVEAAAVGIGGLYEIASAVSVAPGAAERIAEGGHVCAVISQAEGATGGVDDAGHASIVTLERDRVAVTITQCGAAVLRRRRGMLHRPAG